MAILLNAETNQKVTLLAHQLLGRNLEMHNIVLQNKHASRMHAIINWDGESWGVRDSSTNGTFLNGDRLPSGSVFKLQQGDRMHFGHIKSDAWVLVDDEPPKSMLLPTSADLPIIELSAITALPSEESPEVMLYLSADGDWICESHNGTSVLSNNDLVGVSDKVWRFMDVKAVTQTQSANECVQLFPTDVGFQFQVSQNEEHVFVTLKVSDQAYDLGERAHHYLLLELARKRLHDKAEGVGEAEQGWVDKDLLCKSLGMSESHINIQIYRLRKQLISVLPHIQVSQKIIERRNGELRFAWDSIEIEGGLPIYSHPLLSEVNAG